MRQVPELLLDWAMSPMHPSGHRPKGCHAAFLAHIRRHWDVYQIAQLFQVPRGKLLMQESWLGKFQGGIGNRTRAGESSSEKHSPQSSKSSSSGMPGAKGNAKW
jgi:hypothetical protein